MFKTATRSTQRARTGAIALLLSGWCGLAAAQTRTALAFPEDAAHWTGDHLAFQTNEGFPNGVMTVREGTATLKGATFSEGTIEFDMKPLAFADTGVIFHQKDEGTAEFVYVRADPECPAVNDCVQYTPILHDRMQWNAYPKYQTGAPIAPAGWNHLRLVVSGSRMRLYVNERVKPTLDVPMLLGLADDGTIAVKGPAQFANFIIRPEDRGDDQPAPAPVVAPGTIRQWALGPTTAPLAGRTPSIADMPRSGWRSVEAEDDGELNLSRYIEHASDKTPHVAWLRTRVNAAQAGERTLDFGFVSRAWLFLNGRLVHAGENFYYPTAGRLEPEGRLSFDNARVRLPLRKGENEIVVASDDIWRKVDGSLRMDYYGWAVEARFEDPAGLTLQSPGS